MNVKDSLSFRGGDRAIWMCPDMQDSGKPLYGMNMWLSPTKTRQDRIDTRRNLHDGLHDRRQRRTVFAAASSQSITAPSLATPARCTSPSWTARYVARCTDEYVGCDVGDPARRDIRWAVPESNWTPPAP